MKYAIFFFATSLILNSAQARNICPTGTTEVIACEAKAFLALYPFVSVCNDGANELVLLDPGSTQLPVAYLAEKMELNDKITWKAVAEDTDDLTLTFDRNGGPKSNAVLRFESIFSARVAKYICK